MLLGIGAVGTVRFPLNLCSKFSKEGKKWFFCEHLFYFPQKGICSFC